MHEKFEKSSAAMPQIYSLFFTGRQKVSQDVRGCTQNAVCRVKCQSDNHNRLSHTNNNGIRGGKFRCQHVGCDVEIL
jgi:hypothetical protein